MIHNSAEDYAQRLYARLPAHYRVYDAEKGYPLLALLRVVGAQAANLRTDLDALWDNFFIETCDDWVVPYLGALVGANLLAHPVGQSGRLDVRNTVSWRRRKGTPAMLREMAQAISGWPTDLAEFFQSLGWSQNVNHIRRDHPLLPDLTDPYRLSLLGRAADPFAHAADFKPARALDQARVTPGSLGVGRAGWGTPGRYQIKNLGLFVRRLQTFALNGVTPAAVAPGLPPPGAAACYTFDPLFRETPLFVRQTGTPLTRAAFDRAPWETFGSDVAVRQFGVLLASGDPPAPEFKSSRDACTFGDRGAGLALHSTEGLRLMNPRLFQQGSAHFLLTARWKQNGVTRTLGAISTLHAAARSGHGDGDAYHLRDAATGKGRLILTVQTGRNAHGWTDLPSAPSARFPGAVLAVRADRAGPPRAADALYVYLPPALVTPGDTLTYFIADDGSAYTNAGLTPVSLARASEGPVYPARILSRSTAPAGAFLQLNRGPGGMHLPDPTRFGGAAVRFEADLFTGAPQPLGAIATVNRPRDTNFPGEPDTNPWPAFTYRSSRAAQEGQLDNPAVGLPAILIQPLTGNFVPACELILTNRAGQSLLVYLPEINNAPAEGVRLFVADDGSTYFVPADNVGQLQALAQATLSGLRLARASAGQVLPISGVLPLRQRQPVALDLCRCERNALLLPGELGLDPERGRFALPPQGNSALGQNALTVDYVEAFSDRVGARNFDRRLTAPEPGRLRLVSRSGDAQSEQNPTLARDHIHTSLTDALNAAVDGDVIEIADSATYAHTVPILFSGSGVKRLTLRAGAGQRPCLTFYAATGAPLSSGLRFGTEMDALELNGLLISGGPLTIAQQVRQLWVIACTLDPLTATDGASLRADDAERNHDAAYLLCRCITGGVRVGAGVRRLTCADSIVDQRNGLAIGGLPLLDSPPSSPPFGGDVLAGPPAGRVQLERVTVFGRIRCDALSASECLLDALAGVDDQQAGCIRFSRYEPGSVLPRRYQCVPTDAQRAACTPRIRCIGPLFNAHRFGRPDYTQLAAACPPEIVTASESGAEVGAFAGTLNTNRLANLNVKLQEFLPVGLTALVIAET